MDTGKIKFEGDPDSCKKCGGKVYDLERICSKSAVWHKQCFAVSKNSSEIVRMDISY